MASDGFADPEALKLLISQGFDPISSENALKIFGNKIEDALNFLRTGTNHVFQSPDQVSYRQCPLLYLILEIADAFFSIPDHCSVCGEELLYPGIKPSVCNNELCYFSFKELGVGSNICLELRRDPLANDFIISLAAAAAKAPPQPPVFDPQPPDFDVNFFKTLPSVSVMANCQDDAALIELIGMRSFEILRFIILANKAQLSTVPKDLRVKGFPNRTAQFLITSVSPESEIAFQQYGNEYGKGYLWHGSGVSRWYRILHTGLKVCSGGEFQVHGGQGIYLSDSYYYSLAYSNQFYSYHNNSSKSGYPRSVLGNFIVISMVEVSPGPKFKIEIPHEFTQSDDVGLITRMLIAVPVNEANTHYGYNYNSDKDFILNPGIKKEEVNKFKKDYRDYGYSGKWGDYLDAVNPKVPSLSDLINFYSDQNSNNQDWSSSVYSK